MADTAGGRPDEHLVLLRIVDVDLLHRQRLGGATRSICDVNEVRAVPCEGLDSIEYRLHRGFISRGEVLEGESALGAQDVSYLHGRFQTVARDGGRQHLGGDGQAERTPKG